MEYFSGFNVKQVLVDMISDISFDFLLINDLVIVVNFIGETLVMISFKILVEDCCTADPNEISRPFSCFNKN